MKHFRAISIAVVVFFHLVAALPIPNPVRKSEIKRPTVQADLRLWVDMLHSVGVDVEIQWLGEQTIAVTGVLAKMHRTAQAPFQPIFDLTRTGQAWALFASPTRHPDRLTIRIEENGRWRTIFRRLDPEFRWNEDIFRYRRIRAIHDFSSDRPARSYRRLSHWVAKRAFKDFPEASRVRLVHVRTPIALPWEEPFELKDRVVRTHKRKSHTGEALAGELILP